MQHYRHSTKQSLKGQDFLRSKASASLLNDRQVLCDSIYDQTYGLDLPPSSIAMLDNVVVAMTGCNASVTKSRRNIYTMERFVYGEELTVRVMFLQPEVSSATAHTKSEHLSRLYESRNRFQKTVSNPSLGMLSVSSEKCQVAGRMSPYVVDGAGLGSSSTWSYFNASKSRITYLVCSSIGARVMCLTKETVHIYQSFCPPECAIVYMSDSKCFKVTASPDSIDFGDSPNKSTCIFLYCDGSFKVTGTPHKAYKVCKLFRETIVRAHLSKMERVILGSLRMDSPQV